MDDSLLPPSDLDAIHGDLVVHSANSGYLDTSQNSTDDYFSSLPQLTTLSSQSHLDLSASKVAKASILKHISLLDNPLIYI